MIPGNKSLSIAVCASGTEHHDMAVNLSLRLSIPMVSDDTGLYEFLLLYSPKGLILKHTGKNRFKPLTVDFAGPAMTYRRKHGGGRSQALGRAAGVKKGCQPTVIDATAGLGRDGFILAWLGCQVHMLERSPVLAALLEDALQRAARFKKTAEIIEKRLHFTEADSMEFLLKLQPGNYPDVVYLDPMYPERTKSSLVKKEMRILRAVAGDDDDAAQLLSIGLGCARNRVVVKRPRLAPPLGGMMPTHQITGKSSRFDVYLT